jgi:predicted nuclease of predicted toxin-antitoxin system
MLLFDENLPRRLCQSLADVYPNSRHVITEGMERAADGAIWKHALDHRMIIVSKDEDFADRSRVAGPPPKVIWLRCGNCPTPHLENLLRVERDAIHRFASDDLVGTLVIGEPFPPH